MRLAHKVAIVTGGRGIGRAVYLRMAHQGADVLWAFAMAKACRPHVMLESAGRRVIFTCTDVTDPHQVERMVQAALDAFGTMIIGQRGPLTTPPRTFPFCPAWQP